MHWGVGDAVDWLSYPASGFIIIFLAACLFFAELHVKAKGISGLMGCGLFIFYFSYFLTDQASPWIVALLVGGLLLIIIDGKIFTTGVIGILGFILMVLGCALPAPTMLYGMLVGIAFIIGTFSSLVFRRFLPKRDYLEKLTLHEQQTSEKGYNTMNANYKQLIGKTGVALTPFHPVGTVKIDGRNYSAVTDGQFLEKDASVRVVSVDGTRIVIGSVEE
ncbi:MAG: NfeD family protein [Sporolactobacillus sp.]